MSTRSIELLEFVQAQAAMRVDRERGIIHDVKVLGNESANGRYYPPATIEQAVKLYDGKVINVDHPARPGESTPAARRFGWLEGLYVKAGELWARELHYLKSHPMAPLVTEAAERNPRLFGLSHNASGRGRQEGGREVIEAIESVNSVDVVGDPASVGGLNESRNTPMKRTLKDLKEALKSTRKGFVRALQEMEDAGLVGPDAKMDEPTGGGYGPDDAPAEALDHETALKQGFRGAVMAVLDDDGMDMKGKLAKVKEILAAEEKLLGGGDKGAGGKGKGGAKGCDDKDKDKGAMGPDDPEEKKDDDKKESRQLKAQVTELQEKDKVRDLIEAAGLVFAKPEARALFVKSLLTLTEAERKAAIDERKVMVQVRTPRSSAPAQGTTGTKGVLESQGAGGNDADRIKGMAGRLLNHRN